MPFAEYDKGLLRATKKFVPAYSLDDERNYVKLSLNNLFHEMCHRYIHTDRQNNISKLPVMYYLDSGNFVLTKHDCIQGEDKSVLEWSISLQEKTIMTTTLILFFLYCFIGAKAEWICYNLILQDSCNFSPAFLLDFYTPIQQNSISYSNFTLHKFKRVYVIFFSPQKQARLGAKWNCTPFVIQYTRLSNKWGASLCQKECKVNDVRQTLKRSW